MGIESIVSNCRYTSYVVHMLRYLTSNIRICLNILSYFPPISELCRSGLLLVCTKQLVILCPTSLKLCKI